LINKARGYLPNYAGLLIKFVLRLDFPNERHKRNFRP